MVSVRVFDIHHFLWIVTARDCFTASTEGERISFGNRGVDVVEKAKMILGKRFCACVRRWCRIVVAASRIWVGVDDGALIYAVDFFWGSGSMSLLSEIVIPDVQQQITVDIYETTAITTDFLYCMIRAFLVTSSK